ncbi:YndM family protein [Halobacillus sp. Marseille-Q1614]|uniref:YndM family protein n=1 Tax=Halobacillus sp. Marseille-Q1614 TaxID=2709134 RepID=UPI00156DAED7|nr:YndM family protein [Halobacillus sp. Marseille-Q1614]
MRHVKLLAVKFIVTLIALTLILGAGYDVSFGNVFLISLVLGVLSYVLGDLIILPRTSNTIATLADFVLAYFVIYFMTDALTAGGDLFTAALLSSVAIAIFEYFFHKNVSNTLRYDRTKRQDRAANMELRTEASEELTPYPEDEEE